MASHDEYRHQLPSVPRRKLEGAEGLEVSALGLGCMGMSSFYGVGTLEEEMIELIEFALNSGITFLDTADLYGRHPNEVLVGKAIKGIPREKFQVATKFGHMVSAEGKFGARGDPEWVRKACDGSLKRLCVDYIDLYYLHRTDPTVPIEIAVGEMKKLVEEGKVKHLGLSEASASEIRRAHTVHPITAVQMEWCLCTQHLEKDIVHTCRELGIALVPYSPLRHGFFADSKPEAGNQDFRNFQPRLTGENLEKNELLWARVEAIAARKGCSLNQLALACFLHNGKDVVPIPEITKKANLESNIRAVGISLSNEEIKEIEAAVLISKVAGDRRGPANGQYAGSDLSAAEDLILVEEDMDHTTMTAEASRNIRVAAKAKDLNTSLLTSDEMKKLEPMAELPPINGNFYPDGGPGIQGVNINNGMLMPRSWNGDMVNGSKQPIWVIASPVLNLSPSGGINPFGDVYVSKADDVSMALFYGEDVPQEL